MQVYKARWNGVLVAVKALNSSAHEVEDELQREAVILSKLRHPHIVKFLGLFRDSNDKVKQRLSSSSQIPMTHSHRAS